MDGFLVLNPMAKNWWFKFDFGKWQTDSKLRRCSFETRGFWIQALCVMHESESFRIEGTYEELSWLLGCSPEIVARCVTELKRSDAADVTLGNGTVTLVSRRLKRELSDREKTRLRVQKHRSNDGVTVQSKSKSKSNSKKEEKEDTPQAASPPPAPPPTEAKPAPKKGTRIPDPFVLTAAMKSYAAEKRPLVDVIEETEKFVNHFRAKAGRDATKLDWLATWRNWILNSKPKQGANTNGTTQKPSSAADRNRDRIFANEQLGQDLRDGKLDDLLDELYRRDPLSNPKGLLPGEPPALDAGSIDLTGQRLD